MNFSNFFIKRPIFATVLAIILTVIGIIAYGAVVFAENKVLHYMPRAQHSTV